MFVKRHQVSGAATVLLLFPLLLFPLLLLLLLLLIQTPLTVGSLQLISLKNVTVPIASSSLPGNSSQDLMLTMLGPPSNLLCAEATPMLPLKAVLDMAAAKAVIKAKEALIVAVKCALLVGLAWPERGFAPMLQCSGHCAAAVWKGGHGKQQTNGTYGHARKRIPIDRHFSLENMA